MTPHEAARTVVALVNAYHLNDPTISAQLLVSLTYDELALVCAAAVTDLTHIWQHEAAKRGMPFDQWTADILDGITANETENTR